MSQCEREYGSGLQCQNDAEGLVWHWGDSMVEFGLPDSEQYAGKTSEVCSFCGALLKRCGYFVEEAKRRNPEDSQREVALEPK